MSEEEVLAALEELVRMLRTREQQEYEASLRANTEERRGYLTGRSSGLQEAATAVEREIERAKETRV